MARALERDEDFRRFVEAHWLGLVRSAYLLVGDHGAAEDLVQQTLASAYPHWHRRVRDGAPVASVRDAMVNRAISGLRRRKVQETLLAAWSGDGSAARAPRDDPRGPHPADVHRAVDDEDVVIAALRELPPRMRAVVVLRCFDDLTEEATADVLGRSVRSVRRETSRGLQRLHSVLVPGPVVPRPDRTQRVWAGEHTGSHIGPSRGGGTATSAAAGDDVRTAFLFGTAHLTVPSDAYARVMASVTVRRRRRQAAVGAAGTASVVVAAVVGLAAGVTDDRSRVTTTPAPDRVSEQLRKTDPVIGPVFDWPVRGALGTDPAFATGFSRAFGADHRLLYAEDAEAGQVAIAISSRGETVVFRGPSDAAVEDLARFAGPSAASLDITVAVPVSDGHLVIALMPDHLRYAHISLPSVTRDGSIQRTWRQMPVQRGVARVLTADSIGAVRVRTPEGDGAVHVVAGRFHKPGTLACGPCDGSWVAGRGPSQFRDEAAAVLGAAAEDVSSRLLLDATVPAAGGRIVSYVAHLATGGLLRATYVVADLGGGDSNLWMVEPLRPLPANDPARPLVFMAQPSGDLVIVAPDASRISFRPIGDAPALADVRLTDGVGFLTDLPPDLASYRIFAYASDGSLTRAWHGGVLGVDDPLQVRYHLFIRGAR
jgi:RNA polymerase sigma factor (sigma-70 family)